MIIVLGGSFNPPTKAHVKILEEVVLKTKGELGLFVPSSDNYVKRKMSRKHETVWSEEERRLMLEDICAKSKQNLAVNTIEYGDDGRGHTCRTLCRIQEQYPDKRICLIVGEDKLGILPRWHDIKDLLDKFYIIVTKRSTDKDSVLDKIQANALLRTYQSKITIVELDEDISGISSTVARVYLNNSANTSSVLCPGTAELIKAFREDASSPSLLVNRKYSK